MKKQLTKWFYYKGALKIFFLFFLICFAAAIKAQEYPEAITKKVVHGETLYKYSLLYNVEIDSLKKWNNLKNDEIKAGNSIIIINYNNVDSFQFEINKLKYKSEIIKQQLIYNRKNYNTNLDLLNDRKVLVDGESAYGMQALFEISKEKSVLKDEYEEFKMKLKKQQKENALIIQEKEKEYLVLNKKKKPDLVEEVIQVNPAKNDKNTSTNPSEEIVFKVDDKKTISENKPTDLKVSEQDVFIKNDFGELKADDYEIEQKNIAKKKAEASKALEKEQKAKEKKLKKALEKSQKLAYQNIDERVNEVLVFDTEVDNKVDTSSTKYKKQKAKLFRKLQLELDTNKADMNVVVNEVEVVRSKKKQKFKIGDEVDYVRKDKSKFYLTRAMVEIDKYNYKKADEFISKSIELNPSYTQAYMLKGDMFASMKYYDKAVDAYEKAIFLDNNIAQVHYNMGNCYIYLNKKEKAITSMGEAVAADSTYVLAYLGRSSLYIDSKKYSDALADYNKILSINKYFYLALKGRGISLMNLGEYDKAIIDFNQFLEYDKSDVSIFYHRGMAKMYKNEIYGACLDFLSASEAGYLEADKAIKKYCD